MTLTGHFTDGSASPAYSADTLKVDANDAGLIDVFDSATDKTVAYFVANRLNYVEVG